MLCPEIWNFKAPQHSLLIEQSNQRKDYPSIIKTHYFNHSVSVVFPETIDVPEEIKSSLVRDKEYYKIHALYPHELVSKEFIEAFVKKGELSLLAVDKKIDVHDTLAIIPTGVLVLSLTRASFQTLGLEGKSSFFNRNQDDSSRHVVTLDLKKDCFAPGKKNYERVRNCLQNYFKDTFDVIVAWDPPEDKICPSSIAAWFHKRGYKISLCHQKVVNRTRYSIDVPVVDDSCDYHQFFEWLGLFSVDGNLKKTRDSKTSEILSSSSVFASSQIQYIESTGFFTRRMVNNVHSAIKKYMSEKNDIQWCSMDVQGFADSPISWGLKEHHFYTDGDNSYTIVFRPGGKCITQKSLSSNNKPRIFQ